MMDRRAFICGLALGKLWAPLAEEAQPRQVYRIGILALGANSDLVGPQPQSPATNALLRGLRELGYVYGEHFVTEPRGSEGKPERFPSLAAELVSLPVDVIVATGPALPALKQMTSAIPIVMAAHVDPVGEGLVQSLRRPGGNVTGLSLQNVETTGKRLEMLKELVPGEAPVAVLQDRAALDSQEAAAAAKERGWKLLFFDVPDAVKLEAAFRAATGARAGALLVLGGGVFFPQARRIADLAARSRLPTMYGLRAYAEAGGLISYGADINDIWRRAATYVDKILKGAKPADLPIEQPTKFELVINLKTAKALGLTIPQTILLQADQVIE
jgi:putative ABC transport system substrate-binding protein